MEQDQAGASRLTYKIELTRTARAMLLGIPDRRVREQIARRIDGLTREPEKQGKPLLGELLGYRSLRAAGQRYRIIFRVQGNRLIVLVIGIGLRREGDRKDIYRLARRLVQLGLAGS